ncbi:MAG: hypothetical protein P8Y45_13090 [Exilibacterium sp.]
MSRKKTLKNVILHEVAKAAGVSVATAQPITNAALAKDYTVFLMDAGAPAAFSNQ